MADGEIIGHVTLPVISERRGEHKTICPSETECFLAKLALNAD